LQLFCTPDALATLLQGGFIGFGTFWGLAILAFLFSQSKRRAIYVFATPIFLFAGISLFVNYMAAGVKSESSSGSSRLALAQSWKE
jgi:cytosine/uracil/thiamine/allantoin permease